MASRMKLNFSYNNKKIKLKRKTKSFSNLQV